MGEECSSLGRVAQLFDPMNSIIPSKIWERNVQYRVFTGDGIPW